MMTTDSERREVARRLRDVEMRAIPDARIADNPMTVEFVAAAIFYDLPYVWGLFARLADLIEPDDSQFRDAAQTVAEEVFGQMRHSTEEEQEKYAAMLEKMSVELHPIDCDALLALADEMDSASEDGLLVRDSDLMAWADRIRRALGVAR